MKLAGLIVLAMSASVYAETWDWDNDPRKFEDDYEYRLSELPLAAELPNNKMPWASSYWPRMKGSINYRWNTPNPTGFNLRSPSRTQVQNMSIAQLSELSPAEKFDLVQGHYNYPLSSRVGWNATPRAKSYEGVCDGWTASAIQFVEPAPVEITNPDGIVIPFGSSDVKALMSYDVSINFEPGALGAIFIGDYCKSGGSSCRDVNPGSFHVILANEIGLRQRSFAVDADGGKETWNQPVHGFEFQILSQSSGRYGRNYVVHAKFKYAQDDLTGEDAGFMKVFSWLPTIGTPEYATKTMELDYNLEVDNQGRIIGGSWIGNSKKNHPDIFWKASKKIEWTPEFQILNTIYKPAF